MDYKTKYGEKSEILTKVMMKFTWVDVESGETDVNMFGANGQNDWEKGLGSALTYGERYFLLKYFHIATDEDDIDNPDRKTSEPIKVVEPIKGTKQLKVEKEDLTAKGLAFLTERGTIETIKEAFKIRNITPAQKVLIDKKLKELSK